LDRTRSLICLALFRTLSACTRTHARLQACTHSACMHAGKHLLTQSCNVGKCKQAECAYVRHPPLSPACKQRAWQQAHTAQPAAPSATQQLAPCPLHPDECKGVATPCGDSPYYPLAFRNGMEEGVPPTIIVVSVTTEMSQQKMSQLTMSRD
jgi:hypothetical protein